jgi:hypothetical protein
MRYLPFSIHDGIFRFTFEHGLMDIPLVGGQFMWSNNHENESWSRIYRFYLSPYWEK